MPGIWNPLTGDTSVGAGGAALGTARGAILIDTSDTRRASVDTQRASGEIERSFERVGSAAERSTRRAATGIRALGSDLNKLRGELQGITLVAGGIAAIGIRTASGIQQAQIQLTGMLRSSARAVQLMGELRTAASEAGIPFQDILRATRLLLPTLRGNTDELNNYLRLARRVATLNQQEGVGGAAFAINEALASGGTDLVSLSERFQISRFALRDALAQTGGDFAAALDQVLNQMGITEQMADEMGNTFDASLRRAGDAAAQLMATGFGPLLDDFLTPGLNKTSEWMTALQQANPEILKWGAALAGVVAVGGPVLLFLGQVITSLQTIKGLSIAGTLGRATGVGIAVAGGVGVGIQATRGIGRATGREDLANADAGMLWNIIKQTVMVWYDISTRFAVQFGEWLLRMSNSVVDFTARMGEAIMAIGHWVGQLFPEIGQKIEAFGQAQVENARVVRLSEEEIAERTGYAEAARQQFLQSLGRAFFPAGSEAGGADVGGDAGLGLDAEDQTAFTEEIKEAWLKFQEDMKDIQSRANEARLEEEARYKEQLVELDERYAERATEIHEGMLENVARLQEEIAEIQAGDPGREQEMARERDAKIADLQDEFNKDEIRRLEDFQREEQRARANHWLTLLSAAARLDARGVAEEIRRFNNHRDQQREDFEIEQQRRADQLQERIAQEQTGHDERLRKAREADARRIAELQVKIAKEAELEQMALAKLFEAKAKELQKLEQSHRERLAQIDTQERKELDRREAHFRNQVAQLNSHMGTLLGITQQGDAAIEAEFRAWFARMAGVVSGNATGGGGGSPYASGQISGSNINNGSSFEPTLNPGNTSGPPPPSYDNMAWMGFQGVFGVSPQVASTQMKWGWFANPIFVGNTIANQAALTWAERNGGIPAFAAGGVMPFDGMAYLHKGEPVLSRQVADTLKRMTGMSGGFDQNQLVGALAGGSGGGTYQMNGDIVIGDIGEHRLPDVQRMVRQGIVDAFKELAGE